MTRYLLNKTSALGDVAQSFAVAQYLKVRNPNCQIDWIAEPGGAQLVSRHPNVDRVIEISSKQWRKSWWRGTTRREFMESLIQLRRYRYEAIFDLQGNAKSGVINLLARANVKVGFSLKALREKCNVLSTTRRFNCTANFVPSRYIELVQRYFHDNEHFEPMPIWLKIKQHEKDRVQSLIRGDRSGAHLLDHNFLICPFSAWPSKHISMDDVRKLIEQMYLQLQVPIWLASAGLSEQIAASKLAQELRSKCRLLPQLTLPELQYFMRQCRGVIATDSLPLHLAGSAKVPTFGFFGPSNPQAYAPFDQVETLNASISSYYLGVCPYQVNFQMRCPKMRVCSGPCLKPIDRAANSAVTAFVDKACRAR